MQAGFFDPCSSKRGSRIHGPSNQISAKHCEGLRGFGFRDAAGRVVAKLVSRKVRGLRGLFR